MEGKGFEGYTLKEVINKIKKLRQKYKEEKDKARRSGNGACKRWKFFNEIDSFLTTRHNVNPPTVVDTMANNESVEEQVEELGSTSNPGWFILNAPYTINNEKRKICQNKI